jgi:hypothetical protein
LPSEEPPAATDQTTASPDNPPGEAASPSASSGATSTAPPGPSGATSSAAPGPAWSVRLCETASKVPTWAWVVAFSVALCLVGLSRFGFWDPWELKLAEQARDVARSGQLFDATVDGRYPAVRPLGTILSAIGIRLFGTTELGARLFIAFSVVAALLAV